MNIVGEKMYNAEMKIFGDKINNAEQKIVNGTKQFGNFWRTLGHLLKENRKHRKDESYNPGAITPLQQQTAKLVDKTPIGGITLLMQAYIGRSLIGEPLTYAERVMIALSGILCCIAWTMHVIGLITRDSELIAYAGAVQASSWLPYMDQWIPQLLKAVRQGAEKHNMQTIIKVVNTLERVFDKIGLHERINNTMEQRKKKGPRNNQEYRGSE